MFIVGLPALSLGALAPGCGGEMRARHAGLGTYSPVVTFKRGEDGLFACVRDIKLYKT
ncbi:MAG TPA: hypothetical protein VF621_01375 [Pyrinomonadaceae bacterium]|jgi:hypothetical protein